MQTNLVDTLMYKRKTYAIISGINEDDILNNLAGLLKNNIDIIQYNPIQQDNISIKTGLKIRQLCSFYNTLYIVKSRADIAYLTSANGVLLDKDSYGVKEARKIISHEMIIGTDYLTEQTDFIVSDIKIKTKYLFLKECENIYKLS